MKVRKPDIFMMRIMASVLFIAGALTSAIPLGVGLLVCGTLLYCTTMIIVELRDIGSEQEVGSDINRESLLNEDTPNASKE
jgi:hypothetical protein